MPYSGSFSFLLKSVKSVLTEMDVLHRKVMMPCPAETIFSLKSLDELEKFK